MTDPTTPGGATVPGSTPAEVPADNRDPGNESPRPDGDTVPAPGTTTPDPTPTEIPRKPATFSGSAEDGDEIDADTRQNRGVGNALDMNAGAMGGESETEAALKRAAR